MGLLIGDFRRNAAAVDVGEFVHFLCLTPLTTAAVLIHSILMVALVVVAVVVHVVVALVDVAPTAAADTV